MKKILASLIIILIAFGCKAQDVTGSWYGTLNIHGAQLHVVFHISKTGENYATTMDSPDQKVNGIHTGTTTFANNILTIDAPMLKLIYTGTYLPDSNKINGTFKQGPGSSRADLKGLAIGLIGHSEGGMIAPMVASRNKAVEFIVLLAGPGVPIAQLMTQQNEDLQLLAHTPEETIKLSTENNTKLYSAMNQYKDLPADQYIAKIDTLLITQLRSYPAEVLKGKSVDELVKTASQQFNSPWFKYFITFNPADYLTKVTCPVLAVNGTLDVQVKSISNLAAIKASLTKANKNFEIAPLTGLNHLLQKATTGGLDEYAKISETVDPIALNKVSAWINSLR